MNKSAFLLLEDGTLYEGKSFGWEGTACGEIIFNTGMVGYQEIISDPSYKGQIVLMTYPEIGNYGINEDDFESRKLFLEGFVVKKYNPFHSNWRAKKALHDALKEHRIPAIEGVDTRDITLRIREKGSMKAVIDATGRSLEELKDILKNTPSIVGRDMVQYVTTESPYEWNDASTGIYPEGEPPPVKYRIVAYDFGIKYNILRIMRKKGMGINVVPANFPAEKVLEMKPDGVFLSNGPGDPEGVPYAVENVKKLLGKIPVFGICLGHQILALSLGIKTYKLKFGHHGINHPVKDLRTGRIKITSQNHNFAVDEKDAQKKGAQITHINLNDWTVEGFAIKEIGAFSVQYHPEAGPGPHDSIDIFDEFIKLIEGG